MKLLSGNLHIMEIGKKNEKIEDRSHLTLKEYNDIYVCYTIT